MKSYKLKFIPHVKMTQVFRYVFFIGSVSALLFFWLREQCRTISRPDSEYDYIIVGAGTTGCVLAAKLSENENNKVLLIEAGGEFGFVSTVPLLSTLLQGTEHDWAFKTTTQKYSSFGLYGHSQALPRGKGLGGSGMINYLIHGDAVFEDFQNWNLKYWEYDTLLSSFTECDDYCSAASKTPQSPLPLADSNCLLSQYFSEAIKELDDPKLKFEHTNITARYGKRVASYHAYLQPAMARKNLHVLPNTQVTKILFSNADAIGIQAVNDGEKFLVQNKKDVILSAGALHTPHLLLMSGIGPRYHLEDLDIRIVSEVPGVGRNLHDQLNMPMYVSLKSLISLTVDKVMTTGEFFNYVFYRSGRLSTTPIAGIVRGVENIAVLLFAMGSTDEKLLREVANFRPEVFRSLFPLYKNSSQEGFVFLPTCLQPKSRGSVYLSDTNWKSPPVIDPSYLSNNDDIDCTIRAINLAIDVVNTNVFRNAGAEIHWPRLKNCEHLPVDPGNFNYLDCIIRTVALTAHHPGGTCRIGPENDEMSVVDGSLRVRGTNGLRVMDASVLPRPLSTFPNDVLINLAKHAAGIIEKH